MGYWKLTFWREDDKSLTDIDREHIGEMIKKGYMEGEICE